MKWPSWFAKAHAPSVPVNATANAQPVAAKAAWPWLIREPFAGAWQQNREVAANTLLQNSVVFACVTLISQDLSKLRAQLRQRTANDTWRITRNPAYDPVLRKPNQYQSAMGAEFVDRR